MGLSQGTFGVISAHILGSSQPPSASQADPCMEKPLHGPHLCSWKHFPVPTGMGAGRHRVPARPGPRSSAGNSPRVPFPGITPPFPVLQGHTSPGQRNPHKEMPQVYLAVLELKLDLGVINHFAQIPDNRFPSALLEQAGEPLVQVFLLVFLVLNDLCQGYREKKLRASGRDIPRTSSQRGFLGKGPGQVPRRGCLLLGLLANLGPGLSYCWEPARRS